ncbi:hypothetical protein GCM10022286_17770 [Gryllotalpicola daejeonensis]|uniref:Uncharacterized protein n=2 Tax=Gryllotalpicola daejeonensis TaxID=993087 RepID=A0ABP7ZJZ6_9MICO
MPGEVDSVEDLPPGIHPITGVTSEWIPDRAGGFPEGNEWPWVIVRDKIAGATLDILNTAEDLGPPDGVWRLESRYRAARALTKSNSSQFPPIGRQAILQAGAPLKAALGDLTQAKVKIGRHLIDGRTIEDLLSWANSSTDDWLQRPAPVPDIPLGQGNGWIWSYYSDTRLQEFYAEVFGLACVAYVEVAGTAFAPFSWSLGMGADSEFGVIASLSFSDSGTMGRHMPGLSSAIVPAALFERAADEQRDRALFAKRGRALVTVDERGNAGDWVERFLDENARHIATAAESRGPFARGYVHSLSIADQETHERPASLMAAGWLYSDLQKLGLGKGTFPRLV